MDGKRGAIEWTIGKLMTIVLLLIVLVLIIYGVSSGGLSPLIKRLGVMYDDVLILLNIKSLGLSGECYNENVIDLSGGKEFLDEMGISGEDRNKVEINVCENGVCNITGPGLYDFKIEEGEFLRIIEGKQGFVELRIQEDKIEESKFHNEIFLELNKILAEDSFTKEFYSKRNTDKFVMFADSNGVLDTNYKTAVWQNGIWKINNGEEIKTFEDDAEAIDYFSEVVQEGFDDNVKFKELDKDEVENFESFDNFEGESIIKLTGPSGAIGKIDTKFEVENIKRRFSSIKNNLNEKSKATSSDVSLLKQKVSGKKFSIGGLDYELSVEESGVVPILVASSDKDVYGFRFDPNSPTQRDAFSIPGEGKTKEVVQKAGLVGQPLELIRKEGGIWEEVGNPIDYKLEKNLFDEALQATSINKFLLTKCR